MIASFQPSNGYPNKKPVSWKYPGVCNCLEKAKINTNENAVRQTDTFRMAWRPGALSLTCQRINEKKYEK